MSFILDALRKSDARRKQGNVPDIHTPEPSGPPLRRRGRLVLWGLVALVIVLVLVAGIVLALRGGLPDVFSGRVAQDDPMTEASGEKSPFEPVEVDAPDDESGSREQRSPRSAAVYETRAARRARAQMRSEDAAETAARAEPEPGPETAERSRDRRRPLVATEDRRASSSLREARQRETEPVSAEIAAAEIARRLAEAERSAGGDAAQAPDSPESPAADAQTDNADAPPARTAPVETDAADKRGVAGYVEQWDLPLSARRNLPELVLNIHVYSRRPNERFVLINGERYVEGDAVGDDVDLVEIRREGAVVDFRSHRFLLRRQ